MDEMCAGTLDGQPWSIGSIVVIGSDRLPARQVGARATPSVAVHAKARAASYERVKQALREKNSVLEAMCRFVPLLPASLAMLESTFCLSFTVYEL